MSLRSMTMLSLASRRIWALLFLWFFVQCSDIRGVHERYQAERMFHRASRFYQRIMMTPESSSAELYQQARESFREIVVRYPLDRLRREGRFPEKVRQDLERLTGASQLNVADLFFQQGQLDSAIAAYQQVVVGYGEDRSLSSRARYSIAKANELLGRWPEAVAAYQMLVRDYPPFVQTPQQPDGTILQLPGYVAAGFQARGDQLAAVEHFGKAREYLAEVVRKWPQTATAVVAQQQIANTYLLQEQWQQAIISLEPLASLSADSVDPPEASFTIAALYGEKLGQLDKAREIYQDMVDRFARSDQLSRAYLGLGQIQLRLGQLAESRQTLHTVISDYPQDGSAGANAQFSIALTYEMEGQWDKALNEFRWVLDNYPESPPALQVPNYILDHYVQFSQSELAQVAYQQALDQYAAVIARNPGSPVAAQAQWHLAQSHSKMHSWPQAAAALEKLLVEHPAGAHVLPALMSLAEIYEIHLENRDMAIRSYQRVTQSAPGSPAAEVAKRHIERLKRSAG